jgi:hypothetical protein
MNRRLILAIILTSAMFVSVATGIPSVKIACAAPIGTFLYDGQPIVSIFTPSNDSTFAASNETHVVNIPVAFVIRRPDNWLISYQHPNGSEYNSKLVSVDIIIDGDVSQSFEVNSNLSASIGYPTSPGIGLSKNTGNLTIGKHTLMIMTHCQGWEVENGGAGIRELLYDTMSYQVDFTVHMDIRTPYPPITPSSTPTPHPTFAGTPTPVFIEVQPPSLYFGLFLYLATVAAVACLWVYFKRLRKARKRKLRDATEG